MSKKKIQDKKKKLTAFAASIAMVAATAASLGVATYAWFTRGTEAAATGFDFTASAAQGIQISTDAVNWRSNILANEFADQDGSRTSLDSMEPISTINSVNTSGENSGEFNFWLAEYDSEAVGGGSFSIQNQRDTENYLRFDIYFQNQGPTQTLRLGEDSRVNDGDVNRQTSRATRVGFVVQGSEDGANVEDILALNGGVKNTIWEPNSSLRSDSSLALSAKNNAKYSYHGLNAGAQTGILQDKYGTLVPGSYSSQVTNTFDLAMGQSGEIATLTAESVTKVSVFVWIEGQDIDCNNATSSGDVTIDLRFDAGEERGDNEIVGKTATLAAASTEVALTESGSVASYKVFVTRAQTENVARVGDATVNNLTVTFLIANGNGVHTEETPLTAVTVTLTNTVDGAVAAGDTVIVKGLAGGKIETITSSTVVA